MPSPNKHFTETDRIFYSDGYRLARQAIEKNLSNKTLFEAIESLFAAIDGLNDSILSLAKRQNIEVACTKGCQWCCHQPVYANSYEVHFLSDYIENNFLPDEKNAIATRVREKQESVSKLTDKEVQSFKAPCPLLRDGACSVYSARPVACRIYLSTDLPSCLHFYKYPNDESSYPMLLDFPLKAGRLLNEGFRAALKAHGVETTEFRLEEGLNRVFAAK